MMLRLGYVIVGWLAVLPVASFAAAQPVPGKLFTTATSEAPAAGALRERRVQIDYEALDTARLRIGASSDRAAVLQLNLFDDVALSAAVSRTGPTSAGYWLSGRVKGEPLSSLMLVVNGDTVAGVVQSSAGRFTITAAGGRGLSAVREVDSQAADGYDDIVDVGAKTVRAPADDSQPGGREDGSRIDVLIIYTSAAEEAAGGRDAFLAEVDLMIATANQAYADSGVIHRVNLVSAVEVDYTESGDTYEDIRRLADADDGQLDEAHVLRAMYAADCLVLIVSPYVASPHLAATSELDPERAFVVITGELRLNLTALVHELGHLMGLKHDRYVISPSRRVELDPPYRVGYLNQRMFEPDAPPESRWWTIMSYWTQCRDWAEANGHESVDVCVREAVGQVTQFSNPRLTYNGDPMGVPGNEATMGVDGPANATRHLNEARETVANYRTSPCLASEARVSLQASDGHYVAAEQGGGGDVSAVRDAPGGWSRFELVDPDGGCLEANDEVYLRTPYGFYLSARNGGGGAVDASATTEGPWERFTVKRSAADSGAVRTGDFVTLQAQDGHYVRADMGGGGGVSADSDEAETWAMFKIRRPLSRRVTPVAVR